ncbi:hypothetical protein [Sphingomonas bacterium]|uniref:hypothetical protein n=1 Tax=Sphingomonas bacterium TaxID=1895847 RepID=UPI001575A311|nr:hypothetical protein [Sphingomonas bacterium]
MASIPPTELPMPSDPVEPGFAPPEINPPGPDIDMPDPGMPDSDPGTAQPAEI